MESHFPHINAADGFPEELFFEQKSEDGPPPYPFPATTTHSFDQKTPLGQDHDEDGEDQLDEENIDGEFRDRIATELDKFGRPYDPREEEPPACAAYHPSFAKVENLCAKVFEDAATLLKASEYTDKCTNQLLDIISRKRNIKYDPPGRIGIIGNSGGATGTAMTCTVTEYQQAPLSQETPFLATVELYEKGQILEILHEHLQTYYQYRFEGQEELEDGEAGELELRARTALDILIALFADHESFRNQECATEFLRTATSKDDQVILQCFSKWIDEIMEMNKPQDGLIHLTASTPEELSSRLEPWVSSNSIVEEEGYSQSPSFWSIVRIAKVGMRSSLLERGVIITDLPGLSDTNRVRTLATERYIRECRYYFLVASIARVQSDDTVHRRLRQAHRLLPSRRALVITMIDDIPISEKPRNLGATPKDTQTYNQWSQALKVVGAEKDRLARLHKTQTVNQQLNMESKMIELLTRKKIYQALYENIDGLPIRQCLVDMRNKKVGTAIRKKDQTMTGGFGSLPIFNVSNKDYEIQKMGYDAEDIPLPLVMTGIGLIRSMVSSLPAIGKQNVLEHHWQGNLMSVIGSLDTWSSQSAIFRQADIRNIVEKPGIKAKEIIDEFIAALTETMESTVIATIEKDSKNWKKHGLRLSEQWIKMNSQSFGAFVRKNGLHKPKGNDSRNWNLELLEPVIKDANRSWTAFKAQLEDCKGDYLSRLVKLLDDIRDDFKAIEGVSEDPMLPFLRSLQSKKKHVYRSVMVFFGKLLEIGRSAKLDMIMEDHQGFLMQAMLPIYAKMRAEEGINGAIRRKTLLKDSMKRGEPFDKILPGVRKVIDDGLKTLQPELLANIHEVFAMVLTDFDLNFVVEELPDTRRDLLRDQVKSLVTHARAKLDGPIATEWAKATKGD